MKFFTFLCLLLMSYSNEQIIFDFKTQSDVEKWYQTNDDVMGGISNSKMTLDEKGNGVFSGTVSTENNGGFAMTRLPLNIDLNANASKIILYVKGDAKEYQLRIKSERSQRFWYIQTFKASKKMEAIELPLKDFYPSFRGRKLNLENFSSNTIKEIAILIGNKKDEAFKLEIDKITIK